MSNGIIDEDDILGPTPAVVEKLRGRFRFLVLVRGVEKAVEKQRLVEIFKKELAEKKDAEVQWNVDPAGLF